MARKIRHIQMPDGIRRGYSVCGQYVGTYVNAFSTDEKLPVCSKCVKAKEVNARRRLKEEARDEANRREPRERICLMTRAGKTIGRFSGKSALIRKEAEAWAKHWSKSRDTEIFGQSQRVDYLGQELGPVERMSWNVGLADF